MWTNPAEYAGKGQRPGNDLQGLLIFALSDHGHIPMGIDAVGTGIGTGGLIPFVYGICTGYGLCVRLVNRFSFNETLVVKTFKAHRTHLGTVPAGGTFIHIDISRALVQRYLKISILAGYLVNFRYGVKLYINVPADLDQFRRDYSHGTIIGRKGFVQLGHDAADGRGFFNEMNIKSRISQIQSRLHPGNSTTHNQNRSDVIFGHGLILLKKYSIIWQLPHSKQTYIFICCKKTCQYIKTLYQSKRL
jgi:hypothetical protein